MSFVRNSSAAPSNVRDRQIPLWFVLLIHLHLILDVLLPRCSQYIND